MSILFLHYLIISETKTLGQWMDYGDCTAIGNDISCGPGIQEQRRDCVDGSVEKCQDSDLMQEISCNLKDCAKIYGVWIDTEPCKADGSRPDCGPGTKTQTRSCEDGTTDKCTESDMSQVAVCSLPDCSKVLGDWDTSGPCQSEDGEKLCGPGIQHQTRTCEDGTSDKCTSDDREQDASCSLPDCVKEVGEWISGGPCETSGDYRYCGTGQMMQRRDCVDGTKDICTDADTTRYVECHLPSCFVEVGDWIDTGSCVGTGNRKDCGAGAQRQERSCVDGLITKCTTQDKEQQLPCTLPDCQKAIGQWVNEGGCTGLNDRDCGSGNQLQTRTCSDGTMDKCTPADRARTQNCSLPDCQKKLGEWKNLGQCIGSGADKNCGPGELFQVRLCMDGTVDKCTEDDRQHAIACNLTDCQKIVGVWKNDGHCIASDANNSCGPSSGTQKQVRTCIDGTSDKCQSNDGERSILCDLPDCPGELSSIDPVL